MVHRDWDDDPEPLLPFIMLVIVFALIAFGVLA